MGIYLNPGNGKFNSSIKSEIYVDKTGLISLTNSVANTRQKYLCVSRPRRFGKSMAVEMLSAYYDHGVDSTDMFAEFEIAKDSSFEDHRNKYNVVFLNMVDFLTQSKNMPELIARINKVLLREILHDYKDIEFLEPDNLTSVMQESYLVSGMPYVILIDEWDSIFRIHRDDKESQRQYLDFLRLFLKDKEYVALAYMTGILPIKKYGAHSALNMFDEYSMTSPEMFARFVGFTQEEVDNLCEKYSMDVDDVKTWYNGYKLSGIPAIYNPQSVVRSMLSHRYDNYWTKTETYEALQVYIKMNYDGLRDAIIGLLAGDKKKINIKKYSNDMVTFSGFEDVLTLLIHLGYLGYDDQLTEVFIPNKEIYDEFVNSVEDIPWGGEVAKSMRASDDLLKATWNMDAEAVASAIESAHRETAHITYNSETALSYTISLAYYAAREYYTVYRELPAGKGFADIAFIPRPNHREKPAMIVELKWNKDADTALAQIHEKRYPDALKDYQGDLLLIGISYDKETRKHEAVIETA